MKNTLKFMCSIQFWRMAILWTFSLLISYWKLMFSNKSPSYPAPPSNTAAISTMPICIITGATSGLGKATACALSKRGFYVILVGRSSHLLSKTMQEIKQQHKDACLKEFLVDISSFQSILQFSGSLKKWLLDSNMHVSVQLLINNAGILATTPRVTTEGYDHMMGTNYIGAVDPGTAKTNIMREVPSFLSCTAFVVLKLLGLLQSPEDGIGSILDASLAPAEISGLYFFGGKGRTMDSSPLSYDAKLAQNLWKTSCDLFLLASSGSSNKISNSTLLSEDSLSI